MNNRLANRAFLRVDFRLKVVCLVSVSRLVTVHWSQYRLAIALIAGGMIARSIVPRSIRVITRGIVRVLCLAKRGQLFT